MTKIEMMNSLGASRQEKMMNQIVLDDHLLEPNINDSGAVGTESMMILSGISQHSIKSDINRHLRGKQLVRSNNHSFKLSEKYNRPASHKVRRTTQKLHKLLSRVKTIQ